MRYKFLVLLLPLLAALIPYVAVHSNAPLPAVSAPLLAPTNDFSSLPHYPAPWHRCIDGLRDGEFKWVSAGGVNGIGYTNLPEKRSVADARATLLDKMGVRVFRPHHMDGPLLDNWGSHAPRFQLWLDALKRKKIPAIIEMASTRFDKEKLAAGDADEVKKWRDHVDRVCSLDLSNVPALCPVNEPAPTSPEVFQAQYDYIRSKGYKGLIFGSNAMVQGGSFGDLANAHIYCGLQGQKDNQFYEIEFKDQPWNHPKAQSLPIIATEIGHFWPASTRYQSEWQIIESLRKVNAQVILMFALVNNDRDWTTVKQPITKDAFHNDPERMETLARLVNAMSGTPYLPRTYTPGLKAVHVEGGKWEMVPAAPR